MDEIQTANAKSTEAVSSAKGEIAAARKELQGLALELQGLASQVSIQYMYIHIHAKVPLSYSVSFHNVITFTKKSISCTLLYSISQTQIHKYIHNMGHIYCIYTQIKTVKNVCIYC